MARFHQPASFGVAALFLALFCCSTVSAVETYTYSGADGRTYVMYTGFLTDMKTYDNAKAFCASQMSGGSAMELAPYNKPASGDSVAAINALCPGRKMTCWLNSDKVSGQCPVISQEGTVLYQGCDQPVSYVCRSAATGTTTPVPTASPPPPVATGNASQTSYSGADGRTYTLFKGGSNLKTHRAALDYCTAIGQELSPFSSTVYGGDGYFSVNLLCSKNAKIACWVNEDTVQGLCPIILTDGVKYMQACDQTVAFVCRTKLSESGTGTVTFPSPSPPPPTPIDNTIYTPKLVDSIIGTDGRNYAMYAGPSIGYRRSWTEAVSYCASLGQKLAGYTASATVAAVNYLCVTRGKTTCWLNENQEGGLCPLLSQEGNKLIQGCDQKIGFVCQTIEIVSTNTTIPSTPATGDSSLTYTGPSDNRIYTLYTGEITNQRTWSGAKDFCSSNNAVLAGGIAGGDSVKAIKALCGPTGRKTSCWTNDEQTSDSQGTYCPLVSQELTQLYQQCNQLVSFVCRSKVAASRAKSSRRLL